MPDPQLRAADSDREAVATTLGRALSDGRLTVDEYEERLAKAYAARTYGDLAGLTADLPNAPSPQHTPAPGPGRAPQPAGASSPAPWMRAGLRAVWAPWITVALIVTAIWLATSLGNGRFDYFWPIWVIGPWGAVLLARTITGGGPHPHHHHPHGRSRGRNRW
jgi:Domain of unknown function (DUF1707)